MAKTQRDKFDLLTLAVKQQLIGVEIMMDDDSFLEVEDFYFDLPTKEIHIDFTDGTGDSFDLNQKYIVKIDESYKSIKSKKKKKNHKVKL